jgi:hypothetical protein
MTTYKATHDGGVWFLTILHNPGDEEQVDCTARFGPTDVDRVHNWMCGIIRGRGEDPQYSGTASGSRLGPVLYLSTEKGLLNDAMRADVELDR